MYYFYSVCTYFCGFVRLTTAYKKLPLLSYEERYKMGCATIHEENSLADEEFITCKVKSKRMDDILINNNIGFIKIDVEGHEKNVLEGAKNLIERNKPNLLVEIEERHSNQKVKDTINFINNLGYKSYFCEQSSLISTDKLRDYNLKNNYIFLS